MGLFSFLKNKGAKLFGKKEEEVTKEVALTKAEKLKAEIERLGLPVDDLCIELGETVIISGETPTSETREKIILALGNVDGVANVEDGLTVTNPAPEAQFYTVQSGDSLSKISKAVYGDPMKYNDIFEANKPMLEHPDKIYPGQVLRIPVA